MCIRDRFNSFPTSFRSPSRTSIATRTSLRYCLFAWTESSIPPLCLSFCVTASVIRSRRSRNFNLISIAYDFCPRLRSRLTLSGRAFLRKPWAFDGEDSHFTFATHANILSSLKSTIPYEMASPLRDCSPTTVPCGTIHRFGA